MIDVGKSPDADVATSATGQEEKTTNNSIILYPEYCMIDTAFDGVTHRNNLIHFDELESSLRDWQEQYISKPLDCFATYFRYTHNMLIHFYDDKEKKLQSVEKYKGSCYSDFIPLDLDSTNLKESLQRTKGVLFSLGENYGVDLKTIPIFFSGMKGFHLQFPSQLFGFEPSPLLPEIFKRIIKSILPDGLSVDWAVYERVRLWRIPNTINSKSGLYKIPLTVDELFRSTVPEIQELAKAPREGTFFDANVTLNSNLNHLYVEVEGSVLKHDSSPKSKEEKIYGRLFNGDLKEGERNTTLTSYAGKLRVLGIPIGEATVIFQSLNSTVCKPPLETQEVETILNSVYRYETQSKFEFKTTPWQELIGKEEPEINFLIDDLLPTGNLIILGGKPKLGKSLLSLLCALSVGLGNSLWGKKVTQGTVLFVSTEDGETRIKKRIWKILGIPREYRPDFHFYCGELILNKNNNFEELKRKVAEIKPSLIVLDPLINLFRGKDLNKAEDMNEALRPLQGLAKESGACVLVVHHARKFDGGDAIDVPQGSVTISGVADGILLLRALRGKDNEKLATLETILKDAEIPKKVVLKLDDQLRWNVEGEFNEVVSQHLEIEVIKILKDETHQSIKDLMQILGVEYKPLYRCLLKLEKDKKVKVEKIGKSHTKVYSLENEWKTKPENEKSTVTHCNHSEICESEYSFSKTHKAENDMNRKENEENTDMDIE